MKLPFVLGVWVVKVPASISRHQVLQNPSLSALQGAKRSGANRKGKLRKLRIVKCNTSYFLEGGLYTPNANLARFFIILQGIYLLKIIPTEAEDSEGRTTIHSWSSEMPYNGLRTLAAT